MIYKPILSADTLLKRLLLYGQIYSLRKRERHRSAAKVAEPDENKIINAVGRSPPSFWQAVFSCPQTRSEQECITVSAPIVGRILTRTKSATAKQAHTTPMTIRNEVNDYETEFCNPEHGKDL